MPRSRTPSVPMISCAETLNAERSSFPDRSRRVPGRRRSRSHAWLNQIALVAPDASATSASTIRRRRLRVGRTRALRTSTITVASSPIRSSPIFKTFERSRYPCGRCHRRSPTVSRPIPAARAESFGPAPFRLLTGASSRLGRGLKRSGAARSASRSCGSPEPESARRLSVSLREWRWPDGIAPQATADLPMASGAADALERRQ